MIKKEIKQLKDWDGKGAKIMTKKILCLGLGAAMMLCSLTGCSWEDEADVASYNISKEADNFNIYRRVVVINNQSDETMLEFEGWCSIESNMDKSRLEITYRVGEGQYYKDFVGLNDRTTYVITQIDGANVDKYHYEWLYHSQGDLIPIELKDADK